VTLKHGTERCFCITARSNEWLDGLHLKSQEKAMEAVGQASGEGEKPTIALLPNPCVFLICDHCEEEAEDDERGLHFESAEEAMFWAKARGWTTDGHRFWCEECSGSPDPAERVPVLKGQLPLGADA
jgi:hypothetical protein